MAKNETIARQLVRFSVHMACNLFFSLAHSITPELTKKTEVHVSASSYSASLSPLTILHNFLLRFRVRNGGGSSSSTRTAPFLFLSFLSFATPNLVSSLLILSSLTTSSFLRSHDLIFLLRQSQNGLLRRAISRCGKG